ncbi:MAG TPA: signal peptidase II [Phenylobacterium sp.]|nr:signal peptidase II [Phenylobacterium sp.]
MAFALAALVIVLDQVVKAWVLGGLRLPDLGSVPFLGPIRLTMVWNQGVSFGLLRADHDIARWALTAFSLIVAAALGWWARNATRPFMGIGLGLVIGGAIGNAIDRFRFGAVVDFVDVTQLFFPWVFNVADSAICVGVACLLLDSVRKDPVAADA